jgi:hypothetical protein
MNEMNPHVPPVYDFTCTVCDFEGSYASGTGRVVYQVCGGSIIDVPWTTAWCSRCGTIRRIQRALSAAELQSECQRLESLPPRKRRFWHVLFRHDDRTATRCCRQLREKQQLLALLGGRDSLNACLRCGSAEVQVMDWPRADETQRPIGHLHPGCGGELLVSSELRVAWQERPPDVVAPVFM